jgi:starch-binding outer membrane protein, SusD/RagB family
MKKGINILAGLVLVLSLNSCYDEWLTVYPKTDMTRDVLLSTDEGYKDALTGVYIQMKSNSAYGQALTMTTMESLVSSWDVTANTTQQRLGRFNYTDAGVESAMSSIFSQQYKAISSINAILDMIDADRESFKSEDLYKLIKGECLALRAYLHFDVLRIFGPVPTTPGAGPVLPYVMSLSREPVTHSTFEQFRAALISDMTEAEALLEQVDPILDYSLLDLGRPGTSSTTFWPEDTYFAYRYLRMNYYAVKGLQSRVHQWFGNAPDAYTAAKTVIDARNPDGSVKFRLGTSADMAASDFVLSAEHIFSIYDFSLYSKYNNNFANGTLKRGTTETTVKSQLYGNTGTDIREANLWELLTQSNQAKTYVLKKYKVSETASSIQADFKRIPLMRISEIYLILVETAPAAEAQQLWSDFRTARNISITTLPADPALLQAEIAKEFRKEFFGEGQAFYTYKRLSVDRPNFLWVPSASLATINYVVPLPKTELIQTK